MSANPLIATTALLLALSACLADDPSEIGEAPDDVMTAEAPNAGEGTGGTPTPAPLPPAEEALNEPGADRPGAEEPPTFDPPVTEEPRHGASVKPPDDAAVPEVDPGVDAGCQGLNGEGACGQGTTCGVFGECQFNSTCDQTGTQSRTCTDRACAGDGCASSTRVEVQECTRPTDGNACDDGRSCTAIDRCNNGQCGSDSPCTHPGGEFTSNAELEALRGVTVVTGDLRLAPATHQQPGVSDLSALESLHFVWGDLDVFSNDALTSLAGLESLTSVGEDLHVDLNPALTTLAGLESLTSVGGKLFVYRNEVLTSLTDLQSLTSVGGELYVGYNSVLAPCWTEWLLGGATVGGEVTAELNTGTGTCPARLFHPGGEFTSNAELEALRGVTVITGDLRLLPENGSIGPGASDLSALSSLSEIRGSLTCSWNSSLTSLTGLGALSRVGGDLYFDNCDRLKNLNGLKSLTSVGGELDVHYNYALTSLDGLQSLTSVGGNLIVFRNAALTSLAGLDSITSVGYLNVSFNDALTSLAGLESLTSVGYLSVDYNNALTSLAGLESLTSVGAYLNVSSNDALTSLAGLESLTSVGGNLSVSRNPALTSLVGLESITSVGDGLYVYDNAALTSLTSLESLTSVGYLSVRDNPTLAPCWTDWLLTGVRVGGIVESSDNNGTGTCPAR